MLVYKKISKKDCRLREVKWFTINQGKAWLVMKYAPLEFNSLETS